MFSGNDTQASLKAALKKATPTSETLDVFVHEPVRNPLTKKTSRLIVLSDPGATYWLREEHIVQMLNYCWTGDSHAGEPVPAWVETVKRYTIRGEESGKSSLYKRTGNGKTRSRMGFVITLLTTDESRFDSYLAEAMGYITKVFRRRKNNPAGVLALDHVRDMSPNGQKGGLYGHLLDTAKGNEKILEARMTKELNDYFGAKVVYQFDNHWDRYLVDFDIKELAENLLGANSWDDVAKESKKAFYKNFPRQKLPEWAEVYKERY